MPDTWRSMQFYFQLAVPSARPSAQGWRLAGIPRPAGAPMLHAPMALGCTADGVSASHSTRVCSKPGALVRSRYAAIGLGDTYGCFPRPQLPQFSATPCRRTDRTTQRCLLTRPQATIPELLASLAASPHRDYWVVGFAAVSAAIWVKVFDVLAANGALEQKLSRKLVHTTTGPLFVLTWTLFSAAPSARFLAAVVPMLNFVRLFSVGSGLLSDPGLVKSVSRSGDRTELLKGPLYYVVALVAATVLCWRDNPAGLIAVSMMCGGDGLADIVGRRLGGTAKLPYNKAKSWAGSVAMLLGGYCMSYGFIVLFCKLGFFSCYSQGAMLACLGAVALAATVAESLPINKAVDDNLSVPIVAAGLSMLLLPQSAEALAVKAVSELPAPVAEIAVATTTVAAAAVTAATRMVV